MSGLALKVEGQNMKVACRGSRGKVPERSGDREGMLAESDDTCLNL